MLTNNVHYVIYNGIQLNLTKIDSFESVAETDPSQVDRLFNHITLRVTGVANSQINYGGFNNANLLTFLRLQLQEPRCPLQVYINGVTTINEGGKDAKNGPITSNVKVYEFNVDTIMVEFTIDTWLAPCESDSLIVLSNRWKQKTDIDEDGYTTLTSTGHLVINSALASNADQYRNIPYPVASIPQGFVRQSQSFEISDDGTVLDWTITDKEVYIPPPTYGDGSDIRRITRWNGTWREESSLENGGGGVVIVGTLSVKAWGMKNVDKNELLLFCVRVFQSRWNKDKDYVKDYAIEEGLDENSVSLTVSVITSEPKNIEQTNITKIQASTRIGNQLDIYEVGQPTTVVPSRGNAGLWLYIKDIVSTCYPKTTETVIRNSGTNITAGGYGNVPANTETALETASNLVDQPNQMYTVSQIQTQVIEVQNKIQLARAAQESSTPCFYAQVSTPISKKIVRYHMERLNAVPQIPLASLPGETLLRQTVTMSDVLLLPSGVDKIYTIRGELIFGYDQTAQIGVVPLKMPGSIAIKDGTGSGNLPQVTSSNFANGLIG